MDYKTFAELKLKVQQATDTETEDWVTNVELIRWFNDAINECEAQIHLCGLEEDYFLSRESYDLALNQDLLVLPSNIYANKIRAVIYQGDSDNYEIKRVRGKNKFIEANYLKEEQIASSLYQYLIFNDGIQAKPYMELLPKSDEVTTNAIKIYYIRNANTVVDDTSIIDIPEFHYYITSYVEWKVWDKEDSVKTDGALAEVARTKALMLETLSTMIPDADNEIEMDLTIYEDME